ncbi:hypothetical protein BDK51DRAFT_39221 [Blyttiomyces helicus]|uniref:Uncharacterized protein n=1 Tax=Blyttiomyces helicus TaxID=388810 RepID=A0A4P9W7Q1_9FUNG|nr:hypothetical protein BDK51DRAFT_39221 [Blyttiomyces helicus]|eukprot:RKO88122.1 hypothetical protein BDK51DRAFT_39221 [Blyttiomyces helicus]
MRPPQLQHLSQIIRMNHPIPSFDRSTKLIRVILQHPGEPIAEMKLASGHIPIVDPIFGSVEGLGQKPLGGLERDEVPPFFGHVARENPEALRALVTSWAHVRASDPHVSERDGGATSQREKRIVGAGFGGRSGWCLRGSAGECIANGQLVVFWETSIGGYLSCLLQRPDLSTYREILMKRQSVLRIDCPETICSKLLDNFLTLRKSLK